jgi:YbbR domain-containing protein
MSVVERAQGTQVAIIGTEHALANRADGKTYVLVVDLTNLAGGDTVELRVKDTVHAGSAAATIAVLDSLTGVQAKTNYESQPVPAVHEADFTLKQTAGVARTFEWSIRSLD